MTFNEIQPFIAAAIASVLAIIAILNPFSNLPQFLSMTEGMSAKKRRELFRVVVYAAFIIVLVFTVTGPYIMKYLFKIEIGHLRIAGGIVLVVMGVKNLLFPPIQKRNDKLGANDKTPIREIIQASIIPMAFPMIVGPGTLSTMVVIAAEDGMIQTIVYAAIAFAFIAVLFHFSASIEKVLGKLVLHVLARIMQVFIVAIGVKMIMNGLKDAVIILNS